MIAHLNGIPTAVGATWIVLDLGGFGLRVEATPAATSAARLGEALRLATSLVVREDSLTLFGFATDAERDAFDLVQGASGIGPRIAQAVVAVMTPDQLRQAIQAENAAALTAVPGIGPKGAKRMILELKDKVAALGTGTDAPADPAAVAEPWRDQVRSGLESLGWSARDAEGACEAIADQAGAEPAPSVAELMRAALQTLRR